MIVSGFVSTREPIASGPDAVVVAAVRLSSILRSKYCKVSRFELLRQYTILSNHEFHCPTICHSETVAMTGLDSGIIMEAKILTWEAPSIDAASSMPLSIEKK